MKYKSTCSKSFRAGMTLIELLVVGTIVVLLLSISLPRLKPMMESQKTASGSQIVETYLNQARIKAMQLGRPCGVMFEKWDDTENACLIMRQVEVPPPFTGLSSSALITVNGANVVAPSVEEERAAWGKLVASENNGLIRFDNQGPYYRITTTATGGTLEIPAGMRPPYKKSVPFAFYRAAKPTLTAPVALPEGVVVDLQCSGMESNLSKDGDDFHDANKITVMFGSGGSIDAVYVGNDRRIPSSLVFFLVGRWERLEEMDPEDSLLNCQDSCNFWITISPQTGLVSTSPLMPTDIDPEAEGDDYLPKQLKAAREFARQTKYNPGSQQ